MVGGKSRRLYDSHHESYRLVYIIKFSHSYPVFTQRALKDASPQGGKLSLRLDVRHEQLRNVSRGNLAHHFIAFHSQLWLF